MADIFGFNFPFYSESFVLSAQADLRIIRNDVKQLLLTSPGERVMRPDYGTLIRNYTFELSNNDSIKELERNIYDTIGRFEPRVNVVGVDITNNIESNTIEITVTLTLVSDPGMATFDVSLKFLNKLTDIA